MPQQCCLLLLCIHSIQESTLKELINFRGQFGGKYWVKHVNILLRYLQ